jgi:pyruvate dehydrogenase E1 component alpha subunit
MTSHQAVELDKERLLGFLRKMLEIRMFEERVEALYREGKVAGPAHLYIGQEAVAVGVLEALRPDDVVLSTYRGMAMRWRGASPWQPSWARYWARQ